MKTHQAVRLLVAGNVVSLSPQMRPHVERALATRMYLLDQLDRTKFTATKIAFCNSCGWHVRLTADGVFQDHESRSKKCPGSKMKP